LKNSFPIENIPFGVFIGGRGEKEIGVAIGDEVLNVNALVKEGYMNEFNGETQAALKETTLNKFFALP
jgi:hypothetical protein